MSEAIETPGLPSVAEIADRSQELAARLRSAAGPRRVDVLAVTKGFDVELARRAYRAGLRDFGENYGQELTAKAETLRGTIEWPAVPAADETERAPSWHMIGSVQRNKVRLLAPHVALWQTVDRAALVRSIARHAPGADILVQVNATGESHKGGCSPESVEALVADALEAGLSVQGLMTVGPTDPTVDPVPGFRLVRRLADQLDLPVRSMGMTRDLDAAIDEGSTMIRVGHALFGPRPSTRGVAD